MAATPSELGQSDADVLYGPVRADPDASLHETFSRMENGTPRLTVGPDGMVADVIPDPVSVSVPPGATLHDMALAFGTDMLQLTLDGNGQLSAAVIREETPAASLRLVMGPTGELVAQPAEKRE